MKKSIYICLVIATAYILSGCSRYQYYAIQNANTSFNKYRTFAWLSTIDTSKNGGYSDLNDEKIKNETTAALENRGLVLDATHPDLLVRYSNVVRNRVKTYNNPEYVYDYGFYPGVTMYRHSRSFYYTYRAPFPVYVGYDIVQVPYKEGSLIIDLIDRRSRKVIWRGYGVGEIDNPQQTFNDIPEVVNGIIKKLPLAPIGKKQQ